jgi:hypothetical protein
MTESKVGSKKLGILVVLAIGCIMGSFYIGRSTAPTQKQNIIKEATEKIAEATVVPQKTVVEKVVKAVTVDPRVGVYQSKTIKLELKKDKTYNIQIKTFGGAVEQSGRWKIRNSGMLMLINDSGNYKTYNITDEEVFIGDNLVPKVK